MLLADKAVSLVKKTTWQKPTQLLRDLERARCPPINKLSKKSKINKLIKKMNRQFLKKNKLKRKLRSQLVHQSLKNLLIKSRMKYLRLTKKQMMNRIRPLTNLKDRLESFKVNLRPPKEQIFCRNKKKQITQKIFRKFSRRDAVHRKKLNWKRWHYQINLTTETLKICLNLLRTSIKICLTKRKSTKLTHQIIFKKFRRKSKTRKEHFYWSGLSMSTENSNSNPKGCMFVNTSSISFWANRKFRTLNCICLV